MAPWNEALRALDAALDAVAHLPTETASSALGHLRRARDAVAAGRTTPSESPTSARRDVRATVSLPTLLSSKGSTRAPAPPPHPTDVEHAAVTLSRFLLLQIALHTTPCTRVVAFVHHAGSLRELFGVSDGGVSFTEGPVVAPGGLVHNVFDTRVAVNLSFPTVRPIADLGMSVSSAVIIPLAPPFGEPLGAVAFVNERPGGSVFGDTDEGMLLSLAAAVAMHLHRHPHRAALRNAPIKKLLAAHLTPVVIATTSSMTNGVTLERRPPITLVVRTSSLDRLAHRLQQQGEADYAHPAPHRAIANLLVDVEKYITVLERCWKEALEMRRDALMDVAIRDAHVSRTHAMLKENQEKLNVYRGALMEFLHSTPNFTESPLERATNFLSRS